MQQTISLEFSQEKGLQFRATKGKTSAKDIRVSRGKHVWEEKWPIRGTLNSDTP